jgi:DNA-binding transcriptional ArsR family regulator
MQSLVPALVLAKIAALAADPRRAAMLSALVDGRALTAQELARFAGVSATTACEHLHRLTRSELLESRPEGRRRCYRLASPVIAQAIRCIRAAAAERPESAPPGRSERS